MNAMIAVFLTLSAGLNGLLFLATLLMGDPAFVFLLIFLIGMSASVFLFSTSEERQQQPNRQEAA